VILKVIGQLPKGVQPAIIKVEAKLGTFEIQAADGTVLTQGQFRICG
jgi:hypothetical protein